MHLDDCDIVGTQICIWMIAMHLDDCDMCDCDIQIVGTQVNVLLRHARASITIPGRNCVLFQK